MPQEKTPDCCARSPEAFGPFDLSKYFVYVIHECKVVDVRRPDFVMTFNEFRNATMNTHYPSQADYTLADAWLRSSSRATVDCLSHTEGGPLFEINRDGHLCVNTLHKP